MAKFLFFDSYILDLISEEEGPAGGASVQTLAWIKGLLSLGHQVGVTRDSGDTRVIKFEYKIIDVIPVYDDKKGVKWLRWIYYRIPKTFVKVWEYKPDYIYESTPFWGSFFNSLIGKALGAKHIIRISNDNLLDDRISNTYSKTHQRFLFLGLQAADIILCQNYYQWNIIDKKFPKKKKLKIFNPIVLEKQNLKPKASIEGYFAWVANFRYQKNLKLLYEIAVAMPYENIKVAGVVTGQIDSESILYLEKLHQLDNVEILGYVVRENIPSFLKNAKYLLNTSHYEGFTNTFLEAMSVGTPILTTPRVNPDGIISNYSLGIVYEDALDLKRKLAETNCSTYLGFSQNCIDYVLKDHDHKNLGKVLMDFLSVDTRVKVNRILQNQ